MKKLLYVVVFLMVLLTSVSAAQEAENEEVGLSFPYIKVGSIHSGKPGYEFDLQIDRGSSLSDIVNMELRKMETGEVLVAEQFDLEGMWYQDRIATPSFIVPEFESGAIYELVIMDEKSSASVPIVLLDESVNSAHVEPDDFSFGFSIDYETGTITPMEDYPQINGVYQIPIDKEGYIKSYEFFSDELDESLVARYTLSGTAINGEPFARYWAADKWGSTVPYFSDVPGIYGPYDLAVTCGDLRQEYKVQLIVGGGQDAAELTRLYESLPSFYEFYYSGNFLIHDTEQYE